MSFESFVDARRRKYPSEPKTGRLSIASASVASDLHESNEDLLVGTEQDLRPVPAIAKAKAKAKATHEKFADVADTAAKTTKIVAVAAAAGAAVAAPTGLTGC